MAKNANRFVNDLKKNVDAWYADQIDFETFGERQRATWDAIQSAGRPTHERVLELLRRELPAIGGVR